MTLLTILDYMPTVQPLQRWLLEALICDDQQSRAAFEKWQHQVDFDTLDYSSYRLIPALFRKFADDPLCTTHHSRMKGIYRYFFYRNNMLAQQAHQAISALLESGIDLLIFKGLALGLRHYDKLALRPMGDVDVLIRPDDVQPAETILNQLGWRYRYEAEDKLVDWHSHDYINDSNNGFDLHWNALVESGGKDCDQAIWKRAETMVWLGQEVRLMRPEDLALMAIINGIRDKHLLWIYDLAVILKNTRAFNWQLLWEEAGQRQLRSQVLDALQVFSPFLPRHLDSRFLNKLLDSDPVLNHKRLERLIKENRTLALDADQRQSLETAGPVRRLTDALFNRPSTYMRLSSDPGTPKHIHCRLDNAGRIDGLYLHWQHLPRLRDLVYIDEDKLSALPSNVSGEGWLSIKPGTVTIREQVALQDYRAKITVKSEQTQLELSPGEPLRLTLQVENSSQCCWVVNEHSEKQYGVSGHLLDAEGTLLKWDLPREYFLKSIPAHIAFIAPGQRIDCRLDITGPTEPGSYTLQFDVVHEKVAWFSKRQPANEFPKISLEVTSNKQARIANDLPS